MKNQNILLKWKTVSSSILCFFLHLIDAQDIIAILIFQDLQKIQEPWRIIFGEPPLPLSPGEKILNPRFKDSVMFVAQKLNRC